MESFSNIRTGEPQVSGNSLNKNQKNHFGALIIKAQFNSIKLLAI
jgi:hypothetical protein